MSEAVSGLLGGIMGLSHAVTEISAEQRHEMALNLRREALAEIDRKAREQQHGYDVSLQKTDIASREKMSAEDITSREKISEEGITSREKIASARNAALERISKAELGMKQQLLAADKKSTEAQNLKAKIAAFAEARKIIESGGTTEEANAVLTAANLPLMEEYIVEEGREGILGFFAKDPVIGRRIAGSGGSGEAGSSEKPSVVKSDLDALLAEGRQMAKPSGQQTSPPETMVAEEKPSPKGLLSEANALSVPTRKQDLGDPSTWDVVEQSGQYFLMTKDGPVQMTAKQIAQWKAATGKK